MANKYFSWSFDDGLEQDKRIIQILKKYGIGATFHLNSGLFGVRRYISRIGNLGMHETPADQFEAKSFHLLPASHHYRIPREELKAVYAGFEIASHTVKKNVKDKSKKTSTPSHPSSNRKSRDFPIRSEQARSKAGMLCLRQGSVTRDSRLRPVPSLSRTTR